MDCGVPDCPKPARCQELCDMHYARVLKYGGTGPARMIGKWAPLEVRFTDNVQLLGPLRVRELGPCHLWCGSLTSNGYGKICDKGHQILAHRLAWFLTYGEWPLRLGSLCGNRRCVRVDHLRELIRRAR